MVMIYADGWCGGLASATFVVGDEGVKVNVERSAIELDQRCMEKTRRYGLVLPAPVLPAS